MSLRGCSNAGADASAFYDSGIERQTVHHAGSYAASAGDSRQSRTRGVHADVPDTRSSGSTGDANALSTASSGETGAERVYADVPVSGGSPSGTATGQACRYGRVHEIFPGPAAGAVHSRRASRL